MSKLYRKPIEVKTNPEGLPIEFRWRGQWYQAMDRAIKEYKPSIFEFKPHIYLLRYRCITKQGLVCDLYKDEDEWVLEKKGLGFYFKIM